MPLALIALLAKLALVPGMIAAFFSGAFFTSVLKNVQTYWRFYLPALLIALNLFAFHGWNGEHAKLLKEHTAHQLDVSNFKTAQVEANAKAQAEKAAVLKESKQNAANADEKYRSLLAGYRANLLRYQANQDRTGSTEHHQLSTPQGGNGPGGGPELPATEATGIIISMGDADVCAINTARLQAVHDWATSLPKETK